MIKRDRTLRVWWVATMGREERRRRIFRQRRLVIEAAWVSVSVTVQRTAATTAAAASLVVLALHRTI